MDFAKTYDQAMSALSAAETRHRAALGALNSALTGGEAHKVGALREAAGKTETALAEALEKAQAAHKAYWRARADAMIPSLRMAALQMRLFNRICALIDWRNQDRAGQVIAETLADSSAYGGGKVDLITADAVPLEQPTSELLEDFQGSWRATGAR